MTRICPLKYAGWINNQDSDFEKVYCDEEKCEMWDSVRERCELRHSEVK